MGCIEEILLDVCAEISLVSQHQAIAILSFGIIKIAQVMDICRRHVMAVDNTTLYYRYYNCMEFVSVIIYVL